MHHAQKIREEEEAITFQPPLIAIKLLLVGIGFFIVFFLDYLLEKKKVYWRTALRDIIFYTK